MGKEWVRRRKEEGNGGLGRMKGGKTEGTETERRRDGKGAKLTGSDTERTRKRSRYETERIRKRSGCENEIGCATERMRNRRDSTQSGDAKLAVSEIPCVINI